MTVTRNRDGQAPSEPRQGDLEEIAQSLRGTFRTIEDMAQGFVREAIVRGVYRPGERLQQDTIAEILGISRMPVRAALRQLQTEGLTTIHPHRGAIVAILQPDEIAEIYELRMMVESYLLERAVPNVTRPILADLKAIVDQLEAAGSTADGLDRRMAFYQQLYALANRPRAMALAARLRAEVGRYLLIQRVDEHAPGHFRLLKFVESGDVKGAQEWLSHHLEQVSAELQALVGAMTHEPAARKRVSR